LLGKSVGRPAAAASDDGSRIAVVWNGMQGDAYSIGAHTTVAVKDATETWTSTALFDTGWQVAVGFTPAGKLWMLDGLGQVANGFATGYLLYSEK
jgi:hypothetical protein